MLYGGEKWNDGEEGLIGVMVEKVEYRRGAEREKNNTKDVSTNHTETYYFINVLKKTQRHTHTNIYICIDINTYIYDTHIMHTHIHMHRHTYI